MPWEKSFDMDQVLDTAMRAFWARGYEATSMQDLVNCTGINRGSLYATYGDKRALFLAALNRYIGWMRDELLADIAARHGPREAIRQSFLVFAAGQRGHVGQRGCFVTNTALEVAPHDKEIAKVVARVQRKIEAHFAELIGKGKALGEIPPHVDPAASAQGLLASFIGLAVLARSRPNKTLLLSVVDDAMRRLD